MADDHKSFLSQVTFGGDVSPQRLGVIPNTVPPSLHESNQSIPLSPLIVQSELEEFLRWKEANQHVVQDVNSQILPTTETFEKLSLADTAQKKPKGGQIGAERARRKKKMNLRKLLHSYYRRKNNRNGRKLITEEDLLKYPSHTYDQLIELKQQERRQEREERLSKARMSSILEGISPRLRKARVKKVLDVDQLRKQPDRETKPTCLNELEIQIRSHRTSVSSPGLRFGEGLQQKSSESEVLYTPEQLLDKQRREQDPYYPIRLYDQADEDYTCDVCLEKSPEDGNEIVVCELCNAAVHQACYGGALNYVVPPGDWFCERCEHLKANSQQKCDEIKCFICHDVQGIMRIVNQADRTKVWAHIFCVQWIPEVHFQDESKSSLLGAISLKRFQIQCSWCRFRDGAVIQCDFRDCAVSVHPRCAVKKGMIFDHEEMEKYINKFIENGDEYDMPIFCDQHRVQGCLLFREFGAKGISSEPTKKSKVIGKHRVSVSCGEDMNKALKQISKHWRAQKTMRPMQKQMRRPMMKARLKSDPASPALRGSLPSESRVTSMALPPSSFQFSRQQSSNGVNEWSFPQPILSLPMFQAPQEPFQSQVFPPPTFSLSSFLPTVNLGNQSFQPNSAASLFSKKPLRLKKKKETSPRKRTPRRQQQSSRQTSLQRRVSTQDQYLQSRISAMTSSSHKNSQVSRFLKKMESSINKAKRIKARK